LRPFLLVWPKFRQRAIVVGAGPRGQAIARAIQAYLDADYELVGFIDDDPSLQGQTIAGVSVVGRGSDLVSRATETGASEIILATNPKPQGGLREALMDCHERGLALTPMSLLYGQITGRIPVEYLDDWLDVVPLRSSSIFNIYSWMKRLIDVAIAALGLAVLAPLSPLLALAIYLDAPGPIVESEERVGRAGQAFRLLKFRSQEGDGRITRVGYWLRRIRLDGWPQLVNVCGGEMSLVGPRPERPELVARLEKEVPFYRLRHSVRPGLVSWAQVHGLCGPSPEEARVELEYDLYYLQQQSLALDLTILLRTIARR
jgi:lipopolysaccharide/colanic/teichoic acid biosynthesis glycosyltransferase